MNDKILLAQDINGVGRMTFEGLFDINDDPVTIVIDRKENSVFLGIYKEDAEDEYEDEDDIDDDDYDDISSNNICEACLQEECSKHDDCDDCPISHCCESMFENDD